MNNKLMLLPFVFLFLVTGLTCAGNEDVQREYFNITDYGANGNGVMFNTTAINRTVDACYEAGGGRVVVPKGTFLTGTIVLKSNVELYLEEGAIIKGTSNLNDYRAYIPTKDMHKYGMAYFPNWTRGLIIATGAQNIKITGKGTIDGSHVEDPNGEEGMRGPHTIVFGECSNFEISGITIDKASNYAFVGYESENASFHNLTMTEGWDGIHIRGGKNVTITGCSIYTGDDAIAGGFWENISISNCYLNSACNGIRVIFPASGLTISNCRFEGPGLYPQRSTYDGQRRNMLAAVIIQPGGWDYSPGEVDDIHIHDLEIDNMNAGITFILNEENSSRNILVERVHATRLLYGHSVESWSGGRYKQVVFRDINTSFVGNNDPAVKNMQLTGTSIESRQMPYWGFYGKEIDELILENITFSFTGEEIRPAFGFENIGSLLLSDVSVPDIADVEKAVFINCDSVTEQ